MAVGLVLGVILLLGSLVVAAPPYERQVQWSNPTTYSDLTPIAATDNLVTHIFVCTSATDNATCVEVGASGLNSTAWSGTVLQQPVDATRYWRLRSYSAMHDNTSVFSPATAFFLKGTAAPAATGAPAVQ
jgi:hypothetical protein